jgi:hypothetical protein
MGVSLNPVGPTAKRLLPYLKVVYSANLLPLIDIEAIQILPLNNRSAILKNLSLLLAILVTSLPSGVTSEYLFRIDSLGTLR